LRRAAGLHALRDITVASGLVDAFSAPTLLRLVESHKIDAGRFVQLEG
jgi:alcohol dehydrogenase